MTELVSESRFHNNLYTDEVVSNPKNPPADPHKRTSMKQLLFLLVMNWLVLPLARAEEPRKEQDAEGITFADSDWPWWRGPHRNGIASAKQKPPQASSIHASFRSTRSVSARVAVTSA